MLENLDSIDWGSLSPWKEAVNIPNYLRQLASPDEHIRTHADLKLINVLNHQGDVYRATLIAIPFLIEMLQQEIPDKGLVLAHLLHFVGAVPINFSDPCSPDTEEAKKLDMEYRQLIVELRGEVRKGIAIYKDLTKHSHQRTKQFAIELIESLERNRDYLP